MTKSAVLLGCFLFTIVATAFIAYAHNHLRYRQLSSPLWDIVVGACFVALFGSVFLLCEP